jgi:hypothetical protein
MPADDPFDTVSGTLGLIGGVDTIAILKRSGQGVTLYIQGRDLIEDIEKAVRFDRETCRWTILGEATEVHRSGDRTRVLLALRNAPVDGGMSVNEIMAEAEIRTKENAWQILHRMTEAGEIVRVDRGKYRLMSGVSGCKEASDALQEQAQKPRADPPDTPDNRCTLSGDDT